MDDRQPRQLNLRCRRHADIIVSEGGCNYLGVELLVDALVGRVLEFAEDSE